MNISKLTLAWKAFTGAINPWGSVAGNIADYLLDILNRALASLDGTKKEKVQAVLSLAMKVGHILASLAWAIPTKWQTAYRETMEAVDTLISSLEDLTITKGEADSIVKEFREAVVAWKAPDDETCMDMVNVED